MPKKFQPTTNTGGYLGYKPCYIEDIRFEEEDIEKYDWMDVKIVVEVRQPNSEFANALEIVGGFDFDSNGHLEENALVRRIYALIDAVGMDLALDIEGRFFQESSDAYIDDLNEYLKQYADDFDTQANGEYPWLAYFYKEKGKDGKVYTRVVPKLVKNNEEGRKDLEGFVKFLKQNGVITEYTEESTAAVQQKNPLSSEGIENL